MSFLDYVNRKNSIQKVSVDIENYRHFLSETLASEILKPSENTDFILKNILNLKLLEKNLNSYHCPHTEEIITALNKTTVAATEMAYTKLNEWSNSSSFNDIKYLIAQYQKKLLQRKIDAADIDTSIQNLSYQAENFLEGIKRKIETNCKRIKNWDNVFIKLEANHDSKSLVLENVKITFGDVFEGTCTLYVDSNNRLSLISENLSALPDLIQKNVKKLVSSLMKENKKINPIVLYFDSHSFEQKVFENIAKDLSLGIKPEFPKHIYFKDAPINNKDELWKIKLDEDSVRMILHEGDVKEYCLLKDPNIFWIEKL